MVNYKCVRRHTQIFLSVEYSALFWILANFILGFVSVVKAIDWMRVSEKKKDRSRVCILLTMPQPIIGQLESRKFKFYCSNMFLFLSFFFSSFRICWHLKWMPPLLCGVVVILWLFWFGFDAEACNILYGTIKSIHFKNFAFLQNSSLIRCTVMMKKASIYIYICI